jgi:hypothetical protein
MLTSLAEAGSGTLAGGAHADTWREVWRRDAVVVGDAMNRTVTRRLLDAHFPGRPHLAYWSLDVEAPQPAGDVFADAGKAKLAGYLVDREQLEEKTGYRLSADAAASGTAQAPLQFASGPLQNARKPSGALREPPAARNAPEAILRGLAADMAPVSERILALLEMPEAERATAAAKLAADLPGLVPSDPAMAAALEELLAETVADAVAQGANP